MNIYIVRHGETEYNAEKRLQGSVDIKLNENGRSLARKTGAALKGIRFSLCFTSPLNRAAETAKILLEESGNGAVEPICDQRLAEINLGVFEGKSYECADPCGDVIKAFFDNPFPLGKIGGGESASEVCLRTAGFVKDLTEKYAKYEEYGDCNALVSTHGFASRALLNPYFSDSSDFWQGSVPPNCAVSILTCDGKSIKLVKKDIIAYNPEK